jgi:hypothetical protein
LQITLKRIFRRPCAVLDFWILITLEQPLRCGKGDLRVIDRFGLFFGAQAMLLAHAEAVPVPVVLRLLLHNPLKSRRIKNRASGARSGIRPTEAYI